MKFKEETIERIEKSNKKILFWLFNHSFINGYSEYSGSGDIPWDKITEDSKDELAGDWGGYIVFTDDTCIVRNMVDGKPIWTDKDPRDGLPEREHNLDYYVYRTY